MSDIIKDRAVILRKYDFGETSLIVVALTRHHGKIRLLAKGAKKTGSRLHGALRTGDIAEIVYYNKQERGLQLLKEISGTHSFDSGTDDLVRLCIFQAGLELMDRSTIEHESDRTVFDLLDSFIVSVERCLDPWAVFFALEVRLLLVTGLFPSISECGICKKELAGKGILVNPSDGTVACGDCGHEDMLKVSAHLAGALRELSESGFDRSARTVFTIERRREAGRLLHTLFLYHMEGYRLPNALKILKGVE